ncbi:hypothetical protein C8J56DRAFT_380949 [Mycena floridula]|nr:hypothetical protein C8J56DRAFT_380949 [Mycena floridula]
MSLHPEILDEVLDHLSQDQQTLLQCSLSSKSLLPRSRHHLFSTIVIPNRITEGGRLVGCKHSDKGSITSFLTMLDVSQSTIGPAVQTLDMGCVFGWEQILPTNIAQIQGHLQHVTTIKWKEGGNFENVPKKFIELLLGLPLVTIDYEFAFASNAHFVKFLWAMPPTITNIGVASSAIPRDLSEIVPEGLQLRQSALHFTCLNESSVIGFRGAFLWLFGQSTVLSLDSFAIGMTYNPIVATGRPDTEDQTPWLNQVLTRLSPSSIVYTFPDQLDQIPQYKIYSLSHCGVGLRNLTISNIHLPTAREIDPEYGITTTELPLRFGELIRQIIASVPQPTELQQLELQLKIHSIMDEEAGIAALNDFDWTGLSRQVRGAFTGLRRVRIESMWLDEDSWGTQEQLCKLMVDAGLEFDSSVTLEVHNPALDPDDFDDLVEVSSDEESEDW